MERWDTLCPGGLRFYCGDGAFKPGTDSFLLGAFARPQAGFRVCDLGSGAGLLGLLLLQRQPELHITGVELQPRAVEIAERAAAENGLQARMMTLCADLRTPHPAVSAGGFDLCVSNPPYFPRGSGAAAPNAQRQSARGETDCTLDDVCRAAARLLRWDGRVCLVHRPERLTDLLCALRANGLEPKRLRMVEPRSGSAPSLVLIEARRGGNPGLAVEPPLVLADDAGAPTADCDAVYFRTKEDAL